jgi:HD-GYP domain-containing protein (c-di-GMP phosphodiesterase class II)
MATYFQDITARFQAAPKPPTPQPALIDFLIAISKAIDLLEGRPVRHALKVAAIAGQLGVILKLEKREIYSLVCAGLLHDVGLARIAYSTAPLVPQGMNEKQAFYAHTLMNARVVGVKPENRFSDECFHMLTSHPQAAGNFIEAIHLSADIKDIIASHHELCDGSGYPFGLTREKIPFGARILSFADTVEAVMAEVSGLTPRRMALESFLDIKATHKFDPDVVDAFRTLIEDEQFLRKIYSLEVEEFVKDLCGRRQSPMSPKQSLDVARAMSQLPDGLTPHYTQHHSSKVAQYANQMATYLGIGEHQKGELILACLLHDIGKLAIPLEILAKEGPLSEDEWHQVMNFPHYTEEILAGIPGFHNVAQWAGEHHERMNGRGYPASKKGIDISIGGRMIAIANVFDALTSSRPYRKDVYDPLDALPLIGQGRFRLFDSQLVTVFRTIVLESEVILK